MPAHLPEVTGQKPFPKLSPWATLFIVSFLISIFAAWQAFQLRIDTGIVGLIPEGVPASDDYREFLQIFGGFEKVFILITTPHGTEVDSEILEEAAELLSEILLESNLISFTRSGFSEMDESFFLKGVLNRAPLFVGPGNIEASRRLLEPEAIRKRVRMIKENLTGPMGSITKKIIAADPLGFHAELRNGTSAENFASIDPLSGMFLSPSGRAALVIATPSVPELDSKSGQALMKIMDRSFEYVQKETGSNLMFLPVGGPLYAAQDEKIIKADLVRMIVGSAVGISLFLILFFRGIGIPLSLILGVASGIFWTAGLTNMFFGSVSVIGISFASILLGLGVDYGIHGATRFRQELIQGLDKKSAMRIAFRKTGPAILASVVTTAVAFFVLSLARFRPVRELGLMVSFGMVAILVASITVSAPLVLALPVSRIRFEGNDGVGFFYAALRKFVNGLVTFSTARSHWVLFSALGLTILSGFGLSRLQFQADLKSLRPLDHPAKTAENRLAEEFSLSLDSFFIVLEGDNLGVALTKAEGIKNFLRKEIDGGLIVTSPSDWLLEGEILETRLSEWKGDPLREALEYMIQELRLQGFDTRGFSPALETLASIANGESLPPISSELWPDWISDLIRTGGEQVWVALKVRTNPGFWPEGPPTNLIRKIHEKEPKAVIASIPRLGAELRNLVTSDFRKLGGWCVLLICLVLLLSFQGRFLFFLFSILPVLLGCLWILGLCGSFGIPINIFSIILAPVLIGIGLDDGLHSIHGIRLYGGISSSIREVGHPMVLTTITTFIGFGSLVFSRIPALRNGGLLIAGGILICLLITLLVLPALDETFRRIGSGGKS